jgi:hypothetical protein
MWRTALTGAQRNERSDPPTAWGAGVLGVEHVDGLARRDLNRQRAGGRHLPRRQLSGYGVYTTGYTGWIMPYDWTREQPNPLS